MTNPAGLVDAGEALVRIRVAADALEQVIARHPDAVVSHAWFSPGVLAVFAAPDGKPLGRVNVVDGTVDLTIGGRRD